ncbi:MAG TPA: antibiotic biosynthesis monooxygenase [Rhizomicrobium sp.]|nr:antibiotic biosynthesis monooxygenase [Rhizomicrobium sp.]
MPPDQTPYYRINNFTVPPESREAFLAIIASTHDVLRRQQGFVRDLILEQQSGPGAFNFVSMIEFSGVEAVPHVTAALAELDQLRGISRKEEAARLGVRTDMAGYGPLAI